MRGNLRRLLAAFVVTGVALAALWLGVPRAAATTAPLAPGTVSAALYASGFNQPVKIANTGVAGDGRLFVAERAGRIKIIQMSGTVLATPFLDITGLVQDAHQEEGLLGLAFHPNYAANGHFFVYYTNNSGNLQLSRFSRNAGNPNVANGAETKILEIQHPNQGNHNGGDLAFGPDGYLYLAPGDGGGGGDPNNNAQNINTLLGKVLRINVTGVTTYSSPLDNPYAGVIPGRDEIWAIGLRNPYRFTFDRQTGDLYIADVGQNMWEEINIQPGTSLGGENYGWRCYEGDGHVYSADASCGDPDDYDQPVAEYCNAGQGGCVNGGRAVVGGYVYRGQRYGNLENYYFFADASHSRFWAMEAQSPWDVTLLSISNVANPSTFGEDVYGELYVASLSTGGVYCLEGSVETNDSLPFVLNLPLYYAASGC